ncbi:hypothetical protein AB0H28_04500 [Micromonospora sp. NPDC050980]|uniref:helix-turn-helix transcriptional regulator n=1 Tax=Micromonospora sp. NPDC050980 TaxID=3155161 RepID=UPI0033F00016
MTHSVEHALRVLGVSGAAARSYPALLDRHRIPLDEVDPEQRGALTELVDAGLAVESGGVVTPRNPTASVQVLVDERLAGIDRAARRLTDLYERFGRALGPGEHGVELVDTVTASTRLRAAVRRAGRHVRVLDNEPFVDLEPVPVPISVVHTAQSFGRRYRAFAPWQAGDAHDGRAGRFEGRLLDTLPVRLHLVDDETGFVAGPAGAFVVTGRTPVLDALANVFLVCWSLAAPVSANAPEDPRAPLRATDRRLLLMLNGGLSDDAICDALGMGRRTLYRRLGVLRAKTGARNRFQLATRAVREGWI